MLEITHARRPRSRLWAGVAGLLAAGTVASSLALPRGQILSWTQFLSFAFERVLAVSFAAVVTTSALSSIVSRKRTSDTDRLLAEISLTAVWLPSLALFIREYSPWTVLIAATFAAMAARVLQEKLPSDDAEPLIVSLNPDRLPLSLNFSPEISASAALLAQSGVLAVFAGYPATSAVLVGAAFVLWTRSLGLYASDTDLSSRPSQLRGTPTILLALLSLVLALVPFVRIPGGMGSSQRRPWQLFPARQVGYKPVLPRVAAGSADPGSPGSYGILLWPEKPTYTHLVAPTPAIETNLDLFGRQSNPLVIPFNGVYWFFKAPDHQPPGNSRQVKASPDKVVIRSTDRRPLSIEAHDYLGSLIGLSCCSQVQLAIRNADRYPKTVSLELILINTSLPQKPSESLGRVIVRSTRPWELYKEQPVASETLSFAIPPRHALREFDEVKVVFWLDPARADTAAKIAIDHLALVPRRL